jgi:hypothetical protein
MKNIVILATVHQYQMSGNDMNLELEKHLDYLASKFDVQIFMEEWAEKRGRSISDKIAARLGIQWANAGTPDEDQFRTYRCANVRHPGHDGTLDHDHSAPKWKSTGRSLLRRIVRTEWPGTFKRRCRSTKEDW